MGTFTDNWALIDWLNGEVFNMVFTGGTCTDTCMLWVWLWGLVSLNIHLFFSSFHSRFKNGLIVPDSAFNFAIKGILYTNPIFMSDGGGGGGGGASIIWATFSFTLNIKYNYHSSLSNGNIITTWANSFRLQHQANHISPSDEHFLRVREAEA